VIGIGVVTCSVIRAVSVVLQAGESMLSTTICRSNYPTVCPHLPSLDDLRVRPWACKFSGLGGGTAFCRQVINCVALMSATYCPSLLNIFPYIRLLLLWQICTSLAKIQRSLGARARKSESKRRCRVVHRNLDDEPMKGTSDGSKACPGISKRWLNALTMAGSHGSAEAANTSAALIKSASQTVLGSALGTVRPIKISISASDTRRKHEPRKC
jgi:hypothetical protein